MKSSSSNPQAVSQPSDGKTSAPHGWMKVGAIAAASAVLGGLAAAWFYRKTLSQLREAENEIPESTEDAAREDF